MSNATIKPEPTDAISAQDQTQSSVLNPFNDLAWLRDECRDRRIPVPSNATPAEVIPFVKKAIARHNQIGELIPVNCDSRQAWQALADDWQDFLQKLENLQNPAKNPATPANQQLPIWPASGQKLPEVANTLPEVAKKLPDLANGLPEVASQVPLDQPHPNSAASRPNQKSSMTTASPSAAESTSPKNPQSEIPNPQSIDDPPKSELEYADLTDGFATESERLAAARAELDDHLANRPVRFAKLSPAQQASVFALLESGFSTRAISKILAEPPLGIRVSKTSVGEWLKKYQFRLIEEKNRRQAEAKLQSALDTLDKTPNSDAAFQQAAQRALKLRILTSDDAPLDTLDQLVATLVTLRKQSLAERKQTHAENSP
jgi:hypothetical protein